MSLHGSAPVGLHSLFLQGVTQGCKGRDEAGGALGSQTLPKGDFMIRVTWACVCKGLFFFHQGKITGKALEGWRYLSNSTL